jgi:hypothetical protein
MAFVGGLLVWLGFLALGVAVLGLIRRRVQWTRVIRTRRDAAFLLGAGLVVMMIGGAVSPTPVPATPTAKPLPSTSPASSAPASAAAPTAPTAPTAPPSASPVAVPAVSSVPSPAATRPIPAVTQPSAPIASTTTATIPSQRSVAAPRVRVAPPTQRAPRSSAGSGVTSGGGSGTSPSDTYTNVDGNQVQRPTYAASAPSGATAKCRDGSYSFSQHRSGTCSGHGGVAQWL